MPAHRVILAAFVLAFHLPAFGEEDVAEPGNETAAAVEQEKPPPAPVPQAEPPPSEQPRPVSSAASSPPDGELAVDQGWDGSWALLFGLNNILVVPAVLSAPTSAFDAAGMGLALHLSPETSLRLGLASRRVSNPPTLVEEIVELGDERLVVQRHSQPTGPTSTIQLGVTIDYLRRLLSAPVAPHLGGGIFGAWARDDRVWRDDITVPDQVTSVDDTRHRMALGLRGVIGAEWRVHPSFAFFAEYEVRTEIYSRTTAATSTVLEATVNDEQTTSRTQDYSIQTSWLNVATGLSQGFALGLAVHFP